MSQKWLFAVASVLATSTLASAQTLSVVYPSTHAESRALRDIDRGNAPVNGPVAIRVHHGQLAEEPTVPELGPDAPDPVVQIGPGPLITASAGTDFGGVGASGYIPSDNNIAVGPNHVFEVANVTYAIYSKVGVLLKTGYLNSLFSGLGSCGANNSGDPIVQYDRFADRWLVSQLGSLNNPYSECIAVSTSGDPLGTYKMWSYSFGTALNDYPKFGVWPTATNSAYLATYNLFYGGSGADLCAYDRTAMIAGALNPAQICYSGNISGWSYLPADVDGATPPLDGTPGYFVDLYSTGSGVINGSLGVYKLKPDFANPANSTLSSFSSIAVSSFSTASDIPQPGTSNPLLDALSDRLMYRLAFRMFGDHEAMVVTHSVNNSGIAAARWYELRSPVSTSGTFTKLQEGTFSPDSVHRWMGSAAMDGAGDIGLGYSASSTAVFPSVRYTGRTPGDAPGTMETEVILKNGLGSQTGYNRWGDYSSMRIDPSDDCTFWYVNQYEPATGVFNWATYIGSFKFSSCGGAPPSPDFTLTANPTSLNIVQGNQGQSSITVNPLNGFSASTTLSVLSGCPTNATCTFSSNPVGAGASSTLNITNTGSTPVNNYVITVQGDAGGGLTHTTTVSVGVTAPAPSGDFGLSLSKSSLTVQRRKKGTVTITLTAINGSTPVTLSVTGLAPKATATFSTNPVTTPGNSTLTIGANPNTPVGSYSLQITGTNGSFSHSAPLTLIVN